MTTDDLSPLSPAELFGEVERLRSMALRAGEAGDHVLAMVLDCNAESLADALDMLAEFDGDGE